jgi:hypothetical protein
MAVAFRDISLADLTDSELGEMRREHETRFVENKESIGHLVDHVDIFDAQGRGPATLFIYESLVGRAAG